MSCEKPFAMELPPSFINGLLTVNTNVNAFHGSERTYAQKSGYNSSVKDAKHVFSYLDLEAFVQNNSLSVQKNPLPVDARRSKTSLVKTPLYVK